MSAQTEEKLKNWESDKELCISTEIFTHFNDFGSWDWLDIADEGRRLNNLMFRESVEEDSPIAAVFDGVAAASHNGVIALIAAILGVDVEGVRSAMESWYESQDDLPPPLTGNNFVRLCRAYTKYYADSNRDNDAMPPPDINDFRGVGNEQS